MSSEYIYIIHLEDLWFNKDYSNPTQDAMTGDIHYHEAKKDARVSVISPFILRYLLFCDQCHDFCENSERNNWKEHKETVLEKLIQSYVEDINWLLQQLFGVDPTKSINTVPILLQLLPEINIKLGIQSIWVEKSEQNPNFPARNIYLSTPKMTSYINYLYKKYLDIVRFNSTLFNEFSGKRPCSDSSKIIDLLIRLSRGPITKDINKWNLCVDADKSKMNLGSLLLFFCDKVSSDNNTQINLYNTNGTLYDAASGSGTFTYLNKIRDGLDSITETNEGEIGQINEVDYTNVNTAVQIKYKGISLLHFEYKHLEESVNNQKLEYLYNMLYKVQADPGEIYNIKSGKKTENEQLNITLSDIAEFKKIIYSLLDSIPNKIDINLGIGIRIDFTKVVSWSSLTKILPQFNEKYKDHMLSVVQVQFLFLYYMIITKISSKELTIDKLTKEIENKKIKKSLLHLNIIQFFNKTGDKFAVYTDPQNPKRLNHENASVSFITTNFGENDIPYVTCFKTLGDFGQIASFYGQTKNENEIYERNLFLTFDEICSQISALFLRFTIFENLDKNVSSAPLSIYIKNTSLQDIQMAMSGLLSMKEISAAEQLIRMQQQQLSEYNSMDESLFGKYNRRKRLPALIHRRKDKSNKRKKPKNKNKKTYSDKVTKLAKKYRIKLDKNVVKNIKRLLLVQKKAKKLNIKITKKNSKGKRIYKTEKELIQNIKHVIKLKSQKVKRKISSKKKTKEQNEKLLREKAKKYNIRLTKTNSNGKKIYKTNKELLEALKIKLKKL
jgi:hypothetical protein